MDIELLCAEIFCKILTIPDDCTEGQHFATET